MIVTNSAIHYLQILFIRSPDYSRCTFGLTQTAVVGNDRITFTSTIPDDISNPMTFYTAKWTVSKRTCCITVMLCFSLSSSLNMIALL